MKNKVCLGFLWFFFGFVVCYLVFFGNDIVEEYNKICSEGALTKVADLGNIIDSLYENQINRKFSPATLLKDKGLKHLCSDKN